MKQYSKLHERYGACHSVASSPWLQSALGAPGLKLWSALIVIGLCMELGARAANAQDAPSPTSPTDVTFVFTADVHVAFNGYDDHQGIMNSGVDPFNYVLISDETATSLLPGTHSDGCVGGTPPIFNMVKDLCNQIQLVRKLKHLPANAWNDSSFLQSNHPTKLFSGGQPFAAPQGVIIGGDLSDCGAGSKDINKGLHSEHCNVSYGNGEEGAQLTLFEQLFDKDSHVSFAPLSFLSVIQGMVSPDSDTPLQYPIYPELGNHDLGFHKSGLMEDYIRQWSYAAPPGTSRHVTNSDPDSGAYSWDWGRVHVVNAGVYAGSSNQSEATNNYYYSQDAMDWLVNDLKTHASDGRPVILTQHFCFDHTSYSWYTGSAEGDAYASLWPVLAPYNVIGIFCAHQHIESIYSFPADSGYILSAGGGTLVPSGRMAYDIFETGPGYGQEFMVSRVTDSQMDVEATAVGSDFNNKGTTVDFADYFNKRLLQTPTVGDSSNVAAGQNIAASVMAGGSQFLISATNSGKYNVGLMKETGTVVPVSTGSFPMIPRFLTTYTVGFNGYLLVSDGSDLVDYSVGFGGQLKMLWKDSIPLHSMTIVYSSDSTPYLVADAANAPTETVQFRFLQLSDRKAADVGDVSLSAQPSTQVQLVSYPLSSGTFGMIRLLSSGSAEVYNGAVSLTGVPTVTLGSVETWMGDAVYGNASSYRANVLLQPVQLQDGSVAILVKSPACLLYSTDGLCTQANTNDSPYSVRTLTQDKAGTLISWRGRLPINASFNAVSLVPLSPVGAVPRVGMFSQQGILSVVSVQD